MNMIKKMEKKDEEKNDDGKEGGKGRNGQRNDAHSFVGQQTVPMAVRLFCEVIDEQRGKKSIARRNAKSHKHNNIYIIL